MTSNISLDDVIEFVDKIPTDFWLKFHTSPQTLSLGKDRLFSRVSGLNFYVTRYYNESPLGYGLGFDNYAIPLNEDLKYDPSVEFHKDISEDDRKKISSLFGRIGKRMNDAHISRETYNVRDILRKIIDRSKSGETK
ncbi:MAG: hypothetical protein AABW73_01190 [Nanoarchaeota archaeon]